MSSLVAEADDNFGIFPGLAKELNLIWCMRPSLGPARMCVSLACVCDLQMRIICMCLSFACVYRSHMALRLPNDVLVVQGKVRVMNFLA